MLPNQYRLRQSDHVNRVRQIGQSRRHPLFVFLYAPQPGEPTTWTSSRFGIIASRRVGGAVTRNRCKRLVRASIWESIEQVVPGWDCLFISKPALAEATFADVQQAVNRLLQQARLLEPKLS